MATADEAIKAIRELDVAASNLSAEIHNGRRTKTAESRLRKAAAKLFLMLTGQKPTDDQVDALVRW